VTVTTRLVVLNTCTGTCTFQYDTLANSPSLTSVSTTLISGGNTLNLTGLRFNNLDGSVNTVHVSFYNNVTTIITVVPVISATALSTFVQAIVPTTLVSGIYLVRVRSDIG
jgi:hypothetical protein